MKNFVKELITNRFGIVLATLNVCYFVSLSSANFRSLRGFDILILALNIPASTLTFISASIIKFLFSMSYRMIYEQFAFGFGMFLIIFQWLFIAWLARKIALKLAK